VSTASSQGGTFLINLILANLWGVRLFGEYAIVVGTLAALTAIAQAGTAGTAIKYIAEHRERNPARAGRILGLCALASLAIAATLSAGLLLASDWLAARVFSEPALIPVLRVAAIAVFFNVMSGFLTGALGGLEGYRALGRASVVTGIMYVSICASAGWLWGVRGAVAGLAISGCLQALVLSSVLLTTAGRAGIAVSWREGWQEAAIFRRYIAPAMFSSLVAFPAIWMGNALLVQQNQGFRQMALFAAGNSFRMLVLVAPAILNGVSLSLLNNQLGAADERRYRKVFWTNFLATTGFVLVMALSISAVSPWIVAAFGEEFRPASAVLLVLMLATLPETMGNALLQVVQTRERGWLWFTAIVVPTYSVLILLARYLTPTHGAVGLAWSYVGGMTVALLASICVVSAIGLWAGQPPRAATEDIRG